MTNRKKNLYNLRSKWYDLLIGLTGYKSKILKLMQSIPMNIAPRSKVLDLGCGSGLVTENLTKIFPEINIIGLDYSKEMLKIHKKKFPKVPLIIGNFNNEKTFHYFKKGKKVRLKSSSFDLVISTGAVSDYGDLKKVIKFVYRILKRDGLFIIIGIKNNLLGSLIIGKFWKFAPRGEKAWITSYKKSKFSYVDKINIPWSFFPANLLYYILKTKK